MHETGLRILIRKIQLIASQYDRALIPMFSYSKDHYFRVFFRCKKGKKHVEHVLKQHRFILFCRNCLNRSISEKNSGKCECKKEFEYGGPLWTGLLWDSDLVKQMMKNSSTDFLKIIYDESKVLSKTGAGIYDIHAICRKHKLKKIPKKQDIIERIKKKKHPVSETHLSPYGLRTDMQIKELIKLIKK